MQIDKNATTTSKLIFDVLAERQRHRQRTDLNNLFRIMQRAEPNVEYKAFMEVFQKLDTNGMGRLVKGRGRNPDRFIWKYNLKDLAAKVKTGGITPSTKAQLDMVTDAKTMDLPKRSNTVKVGNLTGPKRKAGRPRKNAIQAKSEPIKATESKIETPTVINITLDPNMSQTDRIALFKLLTGK